MPGLLDILNSEDDGVRLGLGLLAAAAPSTTPTNNAARLAQAFGYVQQLKRQDVEQEYKNAMLDDAKQQAELRKAQAAQLQRKSDLFNQFFGGAQGGAMPQAGGLPQMGGAPGGMFSNVDPQAIRADLLLNDGKNIPEWMFKRNTPDIQVNNGYAYDKNRIQPGYLPSFNVSQDGKSSLVQIGPDGLPVVSAPRGALDTFNAYQNAGERAKASFDPQTITSPNGQTQITSRANLIDGIGGGQNMAFGGFQGDPSRIAASIQAIADPREREAAWAQFSQQMRNPGGIPVQNEGQKSFQVDTAKKDAEQLSSYRQSAKTANDLLKTANNMEALIQDGIYSGTGANWKMQGGKFIGAITGTTPKNAINSEAFNAEATSLVLDRIAALGANPSNADREFIEKTLPQLSTSKEARAQLIAFMRQKAQGQIDLFNRADSYARQNGGLGGFDYGLGAPAGKPKLLRFNPQTGAIE